MLNRHSPAHALRAIATSVLPVTGFEPGENWIRIRLLLIYLGKSPCIVAPLL